MFVACKGYNNPSVPVSQIYVCTYSIYLFDRMDCIHLHTIRIHSRRWVPLYTYLCDLCYKKLYIYILFLSLLCIQRLLYLYKCICLSLFNLPPPSLPFFLLLHLCFKYLCDLSPVSTPLPHSAKTPMCFPLKLDRFLYCPLNTISLTFWPLQFRWNAPSIEGRITELLFLKYYPLKVWNPTSNSPDKSKLRPVVRAHTVKWYISCSLDDAVWSGSPLRMRTNNLKRLTRFQLRWCFVETCCFQLGFPFFRILPLNFNMTSLHFIVTQQVLVWL